MKCQICDTENREGAKFCIECAHPLADVIECFQCRHVNPESSQYCEQCANPLNKQAPAYSKKKIAGISLLFALPIFAFLFIFWKAIGFTRGAEEFPLAWFIIIAAILGAVVNQAFQKPIRLSWWYMFVYFMWKSCIAIVFAFVLYFIIMGGLISGDVFPEFVSATVEEGGSYTNIMDFAYG